MREGTWPENDLRRAFVAGAAWWEYHCKAFSMWQSDQRLRRLRLKNDMDLSNLKRSYYEL